MTARKDNLIKVQILMVTILCFVIFIVAGCSTSQKVNFDVLQECKNKTFKIGVVKTGAGGGVVPFGYIEQKQEALARIPIDEICSTLNERYALNIDTNVDRSAKVVKEPSAGGAPPHRVGGGFSINIKTPAENAYYGNLEYANTNSALLLLGRNSTINNAQAFPDIVNVTYWMDSNKDLGLKTSFLYSIHVKSYGKDVLVLKGIVASVSSQTGWFGTLKAGGWDAYIEYAGQINEALKRDLDEASKNQ
jgi:hypothetical protein